MPSTRSQKSHHSQEEKHPATPKRKSVAAKPPLSGKRSGLPPRSPSLQSPVKASALAAAAAAHKEDSSVASSLASSTTSLNTSGSRKRESLPLHLQKQLAFDVEQAGGIAEFKRGEETAQTLAKILDLNPELYGNQGDCIRARIRKRVNYWSVKNKKGTYVSEVLNHLGVQSAANLRKAGHADFTEAEARAIAGNPTARKSPATKRKKSKEDPSIRSSGLSSITNSDSSNLGSDPESASSSTAVESKKPKSTSSKQKKKEKRPPTVINTEAKVVPTGQLNFKQLKATATAATKEAATSKTALKKTAPEESPNSSMSSPSRTIMPRDTIQIPVHPTKPEANREVTVFQVENIPGVRNKKAFYHGYFIALPIDWRWYLDDDKTEHVKARVFTDNSVMLTMPAFDYTLLHDRDTITMTNTEKMGYIQDGMDNARHNFTEDKSRRMYKHLLLEFPADQTLNASEIYADAGDNQELEIDFLEVCCNHKSWSTSERHNVNYAGFTVARTDVDATKKGKVDNPTTIQSKGAMKMQMMKRGRASADSFMS